MLKVFGWRYVTETRESNEVGLWNKDYNNMYWEFAPNGGATPDP